VTGRIGIFFRQIEEQIAMATLKSADRKTLKASEVAYIDKNGERHLPIHDEEHVRNAMARWNQTDFASAADKEGARKKILKAAKKFGIEVSPKDHISASGT
jgi:hypothetical protein